MPFAHVWDITQPPDTQPANLLGQDDRDIKQDTMERIAAISGLLADRPTWEVTSPSVNWIGVLYFTTDTAQVFRWGGAAWVDVTGTVGSGSLPTIGGAILLPTSSLTIPIWRAPFACTVTNVRGYRTGGTGATINAQKIGVGNHLAADLSLVAADVWTDGGAVQNTAYAIGDALAIMLTGITGLPTTITIQVDFSRP